MLISVITVCLNSEKTIRHAVETFLSQKHEEKELVVVDGLSHDETVGIVTSYKSERIRVISERDNGIYDAMNTGLQLYSGQAVGFLNSDDAFHSDETLSVLNEALSAADVVYGDLDMVDNHNTRRVHRRWKSGHFSRRAFRLGWMPPHPTFYVRRTVVDKIGPFDLSYTIAADYDFMLRALMLHDFSVAYVPKVLVDFQVGGVSSNGLRSIFTSGRESLHARRRYLGSPAIDLATVLKPIRKLPQLQPWNRIACAVKQLMFGA
ncbi:MAG: glycosyltransferase family 2 protein [Rhizomicrobium sp.]